MNGSCGKSQFSDEGNNNGQLIEYCSDVTEDGEKTWSYCHRCPHKTFSLANVLKLLNFHSSSKMCIHYILKLLVYLLENEQNLRGKEN